MGEFSFSVLSSLPVSDDKTWEFPDFHIDDVSDKVLQHTFSYLHLKEILRCSRVCKRWRKVAFQSELWKIVSFRPEFDGLHVVSLEDMLPLIGSRFGPSLRLIELPMDLITIAVINELAQNCPKLQHLTLDFSNAMQLHDFGELSVFPARLKSITICLSAVIFLEGFIRKIYTFISSLEVLHIVGTYEKVEDEEEEIYEVVNIHKLKQYTPNLRVVNLFGVTFVSDEHVDSLSTSLVHLECLSVSFCVKVTGTSIKPLLQRCKRLRSLLLEQTCVKSELLMTAEWEKSGVTELNLTGTDLTSEALLSILTRLPHLRWLSIGYMEKFNDQVLEQWESSGCCSNLIAVNFDSCDNLTPASLLPFVQKYGSNFQGLNLGGIPQLTEPFWTEAFLVLQMCRVLVMGTGVDCCQKVTARINVDHFLTQIADYLHRLERIEMRWDPQTLRFSDKSTKFIDMVRFRCTKMAAWVLCDGKFFEMVNSNFERAHRHSTVRTTNLYTTSINRLLIDFKDLLFN